MWILLYFFIEVLTRTVWMWLYHCFLKSFFPSPYAGYFAVHRGLVQWVRLKTLEQSVFWKPFFIPLCWVFFCSHCLGSLESPENTCMEFFLKFFFIPLCWVFFCSQSLGSPWSPENTRSDRAQHAPNFLTATGADKLRLPFLIRCSDQKVILSC